MTPQKHKVFEGTRDYENYEFSPIDEWQKRNIYDMDMIKFVEYFQGVDDLYSAVLVQQNIQPRKKTPR
jgi:hypothetical protein